MAAIGSGWVDGAWIEAGWTSGAWATGLELTVALSGTVTTADEQEIRTGGKTIVLTVSNDTWVTGAAFNVARQSILDGLDSAQSESTGWNAEVRDKELVTAVVRTSDTVVTITLAAAPAYDISVSETITATIPLIALASAPEETITASPTFSIVPFVVTAALGGTVIGADEDDIVAGGETVTLTLTGDTWVPAGAFQFDLFRQQIIDGLTSAQSEPTGWNAEVRDKELVTAVVRTSDTVVTITLTAAAAYDISANETITATVPALALVKSTLAVVASPTFEVMPTGVMVPAPPPGVGGGCPPRLCPPPKRDGGRRAPFTGRDMFPEPEPAPAPGEPVTAPVGVPAAPAVPAEPAGPGLDELAAARERRERRSEAAASAAAAAAEAERQRAEDGRRLLAFLEAERAAQAAALAAEIAAEQLRVELLADDEAVISAYLATERAMREQVAMALSARRDNGLPVMLRTAGIALQRALEIAGG